MNNILTKDNIVVVDKNKDYYIELEDSLKINALKGINANIILINKENNININIDVNLEEQSSLNISKINANFNVDEKINIKLSEKSKINYLFSGIVSEKQQYTINVVHNGCDSQSNIENHLITINDGIVLFSVNAIVKKNITGCKLNQDTKIITLGNKKSLIKPNLLIDEYDVDAKHSAYIGTFKENEIFYLMSRGISEKDSISLLKKAFLRNSFDNNEIIDENINNMLNKI